MHITADLLTASRAHIQMPWMHGIKPGTELPCWMLNLWDWPQALVWNCRRVARWIINSRSAARFKAQKTCIFYYIMHVAHLSLALINRLKAWPGSIVYPYTWPLASSALALPLCPLACAKNNGPLHVCVEGIEHVEWMPSSVAVPHGHIANMGTDCCW